MTLIFHDFRTSEIAEHYREDRVAEGGKGIITIKTCSGWKAVDSPHNPVVEVRNRIDSIQHVGNCLLVLGAGSGFMARELAHCAATDITVITGSMLLARRNALMLSETARNGVRVTIIAASEMDKRLEKHLYDLCSRSAPSIIRHPRESAVYPQLFNQIDIFLERLKRPCARTARMPPRKVLMACSGQLFEPELSDELERRGLEVQTVEAFSQRHLSARQAWEQILGCGADLVLSTNNKGSDLRGLIPIACAEARIPWATWFLDQPWFIVSPDEMSVKQKRFAFCWDTAGVESCRELGFECTTVLPLATDTHRFYPGGGDRTLDGKIVYVGSPSFGNERRYFAALINDPRAHAASSVFEPEVLLSRRLPSAEDIESTLKRLDMIKHFSKASLKRLPAFILYKANLAYRIAALTALADLRPVVYGDGWEGLLPPSVELHGYADYYRDVRTIYRSDAVHLSLTHIQMRDYPNQRIFDVGACARIALGERLDGWHELFGNTFDELTFCGFDELREKARALQGSLHRRTMLGDDLRQIIEQKHTIAHRMERLFEVIYSPSAHGGCSRVES